MDGYVPDATQVDSATSQRDGSLFRPTMHSTPTSGNERASQEMHHGQGQNPGIPIQAAPGLLGWQAPLQAPPGFQGWPYPWLPQAPPTVAPSAKTVNVPTFDCATVWEEFQTQFELVSSFYGWNPTEKAVHLATSLRGEAVRALETLDPLSRCDYNRLVEALTRRYGRAGQRDISRIKLRGLHQGRQQSLQELAQTVVTLCRRAYPTLPADTRDELAKDHFLDALLDPEMRWRVCQSRPTSLDDALRIALEVESINDVERQRTGARNLRIVGTAPEESIAAVTWQSSELEQLQKGIKDALAQGFAALQAQFAGQGVCARSTSPGQGGTRKAEVNNDRQRRCYKCGSTDHLKKNCPQKKTSGNFQ